MTTSHNIQTKAIWERELALLDGRILHIQSNLTQIHTNDFGDFHINYSWLNCKSNPAESLFKALSDLLSTHSLPYAYSVNKACIQWASTLGDELPKQLEIKHVEALASIPSSYRNFVMPALRRINEQKLPGLSEDLKAFLEHDYTWEEKGNGAYFTLITNDPERGALTDQELHNLHSALNTAFANGAVSQTQFTLAWMCIGTGLRPIQIARLLVSDIQLIEGPDGMEVNLRIPLAKGEKTSKTEYWNRRAPTVLADCLKHFLKQPEIITRAPSDQLFGLTNNAITHEVRKMFAGLKTWSDRLERPIPITPYRFRYTLATRSLRQGASDHEVARLLTHRSIHCIQYYRASMPELQQPIQDKIGEEMDYFARAFQGRLLRNISEASYPDEPEKRILDFMNLAGQTIGACGTRAECHQNAPIACLTCPRFEPLRDAPWETLLTILEQDRARESEDRIRSIQQHAMSAIKSIMNLRDEASQ